MRKFPPLSPAHTQKEDWMHPPTAAIHICQKDVFDPPQCCSLRKTDWSDNAVHYSEVNSWAFPLLTRCPQEIVIKRVSGQVINAR